MNEDPQAPPTDAAEASPAPPTGSAAMAPVADTDAAPVATARVAWPWLAALGFLAAAAVLVVWSYRLGHGAPRLAPVKVGALAAGATLSVVLGVLLLARLRDVALVGWVVADAAALVALLVGAGHQGVHLDLTWPLAAFVGALAGTTWCGGPRGARRALYGVACQVAYLGALGWIGLRLGRLPAGAWLGVTASVALASLCHLAFVRPPAAGPWTRLRTLGLRGQAVLVLVASCGGFVSAAGPRLRGPTTNNHFVYLADAWLHGRLSLSAAQVVRKNKAGQYDDWARVDRVRLRRDVGTGAHRWRAGTVVRGAWIERQRRRTDLFRTTRGQVLRLPAGSWQGAGSDWYVSFPPFPAVLMAPGVAIWGYRFNDVWFAVALASLSPVLLFLLLARLRRLGLSARDVGDDLWLTLLFAFGTVNYFVSVRGEVWYTAHVVGVLCLLLFLHATLEARWPELAGLALGCAMASRVTLVLAAPLFLVEVYRTRVAAASGPAGLAAWRRVPWRRWILPVLRFGVPVAVIGGLLLWHNAARFDSPFEFGHRYLDIYWKDRIQRWGLFDIHYLPRNLAAAFTLLPHFQAEPPYFLISRHGLGLLFVSPALLLLAWPRTRGPWHRPLWGVVATMAAVVLLYQNTGFVQFAYRFSLDFTPLMVLLLALGGRRLSPAVKVLILWGVLIHLLGAISFGVAPEFYGRTNWVWTPMDPACAC